MNVAGGVTELPQYLHMVKSSMGKRRDIIPKPGGVNPPARPDVNQGILLTFKTSVGRVNTSLLAAQKEISDMMKGIQLLNNLNPEQVNLLQNEVKQQKVALSDLQRATGNLWKSINSLRVVKLKQESPKTVEEVQRELEAAQAHLVRLKAQQEELERLQKQSELKAQTANVVIPPSQEGPTSGAPASPEA